MSTRPDTVTSTLHVGLVASGADPVAVRAELRYEPADPYAVRVAFHTGDGGSAGDVVEWTFARDLLRRGLSGPTGEGDVQLWPDRRGRGGGEVFLSLSSPSGKALFEVPRTALSAFVAESYLLVPDGSEASTVDVDAELDALLGP